MPTSKQSTDLVINKVKSQEIYNYMVANHLINDDEIYLIEGNSGVVLYSPQTLTEAQKTQARNNIGAISSADKTQIYDAISKKSDASVSVSAALTAAGWKDKKQTLYISNIKANQNGIASVAQSISPEQYEAAYDAGLYIYSQGEGSITFMINGKAPTVDIPISIILLG